MIQVITFTSHLISEHIEEATWISIAETLDDDKTFLIHRKNCKANVV